MSRSSLHDESARVAERVRAVLGTAGESSAAPGSRFRIDPGRRPVLILGLVVLLAAVVTGMWVLSSRPRSMPVSAAAPSGLDRAAPLVRSSPARPSLSPASASTPASAATSVVVDVAGKVARPGVYRLPPGSRIDDALKAAGGPQRGVDLTSLNLAAVLVDGQQIAVGRPGAAPAPVGAGAASASASGASGGLVNLNTATADQLDELPGIGPALAQRILDYRTEHGSFTSIEQLDDVAGIGTVTFAKLKPLVTV